MIFDTHCHLNDEALYSKIDEVLANATKANVGLFVCVGWDKESSFLAVKIAETYPNVYAAVGFHPCNIENVSESDFEKTMKLLEHPKVVALGEIGLDYHWVKEEVKRLEQKDWFIKQIKAANFYKKPILIHNRDAFEDCLKILQEEKPLYKGIMHCYSGSVEMIKPVTDLGLLIGLGGPLTFTNAKTPKAVCENVPLDKLVFETDSPYLAPHPLRGTVNEPGNICWVVDEAANVRSMSKKHLIDVTTKNAIDLFGIKNEENC